MNSESEKLHNIIDCRFSVVVSTLTLHYEMLLLCARIGYSPHAIKNIF